MRTKLFALFLSLVAACATTAKVTSFPERRLPGIDFPEHLGVFEYVKGPVVRRFAHLLVDWYQPVTEEQRKAAVCHRGYCGTFQAMRAVRWSVYTDHAHEFDTYRDGFLAAVRLASKYPKAAEWFYHHNAETVLNELVAYARQPKNTGEEWNSRPAYSDQEIAGMLDLYADMVDHSIPYLRLGLQPLDAPIKDKLAVVTAELDEKSVQDSNIRHAHWEKQEEAERLLRTELVIVTGLPFDEGGYESWKFALRRLKHGGPEHLQSLIALSTDAAERARSRAGKLRLEDRTQQD